MASAYMKCQFCNEGRVFNSETKCPHCNIDIADVIVITYRPGIGAHVTHLPTGVVVECSTENTSFKNRHKAFKLLGEKIKGR